MQTSVCFYAEISIFLCGGAGQQDRDLVSECPENEWSLQHASLLIAEARIPTVDLWRRLLGPVNSMRWGAPSPTRECTRTEQRSCPESVPLTVGRRDKSGGRDCNGTSQESCNVVVRDAASGLGCSYLSLRLWRCLFTPHTSRLAPCHCMFQFFCEPSGQQTDLQLTHLCCYSAYTCSRCGAKARGSRA